MSQTLTLGAETQGIEFFHLHLDDRNIILIDTLEFNIRKRSNTEILRDLAKWLTDTMCKEAIALRHILHAQNQR